MQSLVLASQILGCWAGPAEVDIIYQPTESCSEIRLELRQEASQLSLINLGMDCDRGFVVPWDRKDFELRGEEVWGGDRSPGIIGWLKPRELVIAEGLNMVTWTEWKGVLGSDLDLERSKLNWQEILTKGDRVFWDLRGVLEPESCGEDGGSQ